MRLLIVMAFVALASVSASRAEEPDAGKVAFFEQKIRPVLVSQCYECHSSTALAKKKLKGGLRVDTRDAMLEGGDSGPALEPEKPEESLILEVLRYDDVVKMPPKRKLSDAVIADFANWIKMGAPDPRRAAAAPARREGIDLEAGRKHWAYHPVTGIAPPSVKNREWPRNEIDRFVLAGLEAKGLEPAAAADRAALVRRVYFDLIGLPPTPEQIDAFLADRSPTAYEHLVDRLLASPEFGERWGRHWLDVARFAESLTLRGFLFKEAWRYRDYVIDAFNRDLPFDRFVREQVAGDLLPASGIEERRRQMVGITFLILGNANLEEQDKEQLRMDVVDDQIDTIGKAFLAQTVGCARCHDHKFDPIPTRDYYALAGILRNVKTLEHANVSKWIERPLPLDPPQEAALRKQESEVAALEARIKLERARFGGMSVSATGPLPLESVAGIVVDDTQAKKVGVWAESRNVATYVGTGYIYDENRGKGEKSVTFQPELPRAGDYEVRLSYTAHPNRSEAVPVTILCAEGEKTVSVNMREVPPIDGRFVSLGRHRFESNGQGYVLVSNEGTKGVVVADAVVFLPADGPQAQDHGDDAAARAARTRIRTWENELNQLRARGPSRAMVMMVVEEAEIGDTRVHVRGSVHSLGDEVPRGFLQVATSGPTPPLPSRESGRRELADWLASNQNPLTARVLVNRAWHWLFGAGLVRTPDNFGTTGERPSHPELLDHLALRFMEDGWSVKALVRRIVVSRTYRLSALAKSRALSVDPENRLFGRMNLRRLDAECIRDAILAASGRLQRERGGPGIPFDLAADYGFKHTDEHRSVYEPVFRNALPELFNVFDFADPSLVTGRRNVSTVAPQGLFLLNHPFVLEQARHAAKRLLAEPGLDEAGRLDRAYRLALGRSPSLRERTIALEGLADGPEGPESQWTALFHALFASIDFRYVN